MIAPSEAELARWRLVWTHPLAGEWILTGHIDLVARMLRVEQRVHHTRRSRRAQAELAELRQQLGLTD